MSKYTTEVRFICENQSGLGESEGYKSAPKIIKESAPKIFDFDFPIFDEEYRLPLEIKILKHYYTREIGAETVGLWQLWLDRRMNEIMPYYNQLYLSALKEFNPFYDVDITTDSKRNINHDEKGTSTNKQDSSGTGSGTANTTRTDDLHNESIRTDDLHNASTRVDDLRDSRSTAHENSTDETHEDHSTGSSSTSTYVLYSDTPQNMLSGVEEQNYLTNATKTTVESSEKSDTNGKSNGNSSGTETTSGTNTGTVTSTGSETGTVKDVGNNTGTVNTATDTSSKTNETVNSDGNTTRKYDNTDDYLEHIKGKRGSASYSSLLMEYRKTFLNIDMMIIEELSDLFMNVW